MLIKVQGGTNAGIKPAPADPYPTSWVCPQCSHENKPTFRNCFGCTHPRPK